MPEKFTPIFELFDQLDAQIGPRPPVPRGQVVHLFLLGVDDRFARRKIAQGLVSTCVANAAALGYATAATEATNRVSQHIFSKLGFVSRAEIAYAEYRRHGASEFASVAEQGGPKSMIRDLVKGTAQPVLEVLDAG